MYIKSIAQFAYNQLKNVVKILCGRPLAYPSLSSVTLDKDDVNIAREWLLKRKDWYKPELVRQYEREFAGWNGSKYAFAFMGGRVALSACIYALNVGLGDEAILPGYTCVVVPNAFNYAGVKILYSDIELDTFGLDASLLEEKITSRTKVILLPHYYGLVCRDYEKIIEIGRRHGLYIIEDCCHGTGAEFKNHKIGNYGDLAFFSTEQSKIMTTIQGGIAVTNNNLLAERIREYYNNAEYPVENLIKRQLHSVIVNYYAHKDRQYWWKGDLYRLYYNDQIITSTTTKEEIRGIKPSHYGEKMPAPIAAIGLNQLRKVDNYNEMRRQTAKKWEKWCEENGYQKPFVTPQSMPVYLRYPVMVEREKKIDTSWAKKDLGVNLGVWFETNVHPADWPVTGCPNADKAVMQCVNFPGILS